MPLVVPNSPRSKPSPMTSGGDDSDLHTVRSSASSIERKTFIGKDIAFRSKCLQDLDKALPVDRRIAAAYELSKEIHLHSVDTISQLWQLIGDLTMEEANLEARRAGFAVLKASASHLESLKERQMLFNIITIPIHPSEASLQISALDRLTRRGVNISPFETELISFLDSALNVLFWAAQNARKLHSGSNASKNSLSGSPSHIISLDTREVEMGRDQGSGAEKSRPGEEKSLIGALYLVEDVLTHSPDAYKDVELDNLIDGITLISRQTTSQKSLHGVIRILRALTSITHLSRHGVLRCLILLCTFYKIPSMKFEDRLSTSLSNLLLSSARADYLVSVLMEASSDYRDGKSSTEDRTLLQRFVEVIFTNPAKSEESLCVFIKIMGHLFQIIRLNTSHKKIFEYCLQETCERLTYQQEIPIAVMNCLTDLAALCGPNITNQTFDILLNLIEAKSGISSNTNTADSDLADQTPDCLIRLFLRCHPESAFKTSRIYKLLLLAAGPSKPVIVRLSVMKLLARLRCNSEQAIEIVVVPDSQGLAGTLCRTEATASFQGSLSPKISRDSIQEQLHSNRQGRPSVVDVTKAARSRSATRSSNFKDQFPRPTPPLWMYNDWTKGLPEDPRQGPSQVVYSCLSTKDNATVLDLAPWLDMIIGILKDGSDWEIYSYVIVHLPSQLSNRSLFSRFVGQLQTLHNLIVDQLEKSSFSKPPPHTRMTAGDVALCLYHALTMLLAYHENLGRRELENLVRIFTLGINKWDRAGRCCIHAIALCCHEIPTVIDKYVFAITHKLAQRITQSDLAIDILEFLGSLARLPEAFSNATAKIAETRSNNATGDASFFKTIFGICIGYIRSTREQLLRTGGEPGSRAYPQSLRKSSNSGDLTQFLDLRKEIPEYVYALAYQVIIFWFLAVDVRQRAQHVGWIAKELAWKDANGHEVLEEQSQVILDMMHRSAFSDLGETELLTDFISPEQETIKQLWLVGMSIVTIQNDPAKSSGQITKRQASGSTHITFHYNAARMPDHHILNRLGQDSHHASSFELLPNHMLLQLTSTIAPTPIPLQPIKLPDDESVQRALRSFDRIDTVDGHKAGIIYVGPGQFSETEILANTQGTDAYMVFLSGIGTRVKLQGAKFNTQGLDRESDVDGTHTYAWRDRVTEIVFHVTTMMPTDLKNDLQVINKKRHVGNDRVKIIFNNSGKPFFFDTFSSEMNEINIVITPEANCAEAADVAKKGQRSSQVPDLAQTSNSDLCMFYKVETLSSPTIPQLSAAAVPKVVSTDALPGYVRQLALNASVFSQVWSELLGQGEYISSWRTRLKEIKKLREKYGNTHTSANVSYPMPSDADAPAYVDGDDWSGKVTLGGLAESKQLLMSLDFTRWG